MTTTDTAASLTALSTELIDGPPGDAYMLNRGDPGLLRSLDALDAAAASRLTASGSSIAAHVDHLRYGLSLMNRWAAGEDPWSDADWTASWRRTTVSAADWEQLRAALAREARAWAAALSRPREVTPVELNGMIGSIAHLAYHLGAIRQMDVVTRGPLA